MQANQECRPGQLRLRLRRLSVSASLLLLAAACARPEEGSQPEEASPPAEASQPAETPAPELERQTIEPAQAVQVTGGEVVSPPVGSPLRGQILDAVRPAVEADLGQPVVFQVSSLRTDGVWAYVSATPRTAAFEPIDYSKTRHASDIEEGFFDDWLCALLQLEDGAWQVRALEIGATDAPFVDWPERFGVPAAVVMPDDG